MRLTTAFPLWAAVPFVWACGGESPNGPEIDEDAVGFAVLAAGGSHTCGLGLNGIVYCWGDNAHGQLGDASFTSSTAPVQVAGGYRFTSLTSGGRNHTCALTADGEAYCWGENPFGQLGDGTTITSNGPVRAAENLDFTQIDAGVYHTCGLTSSGQAYCWGSNASDGMDGYALGGPTTEFCASPYGSYRGNSWACCLDPVAVEGGISFRSISAALWATCGVADNGTAYCWGWNSMYQLGIGTEDDATEPTPVAGGRQYAELALGAVHGCGLAGQNAYCWGGKILNWGQLGSGSFDASMTPTAVAGGQQFDVVVPSDANNVYTLTCGLTTDGSAYCWGTNRHGGLGTNATLSPTCDGNDFECSNTPVPVAGGHAFISITTGQEFACGVTQDGGAYCWGKNEDGQLGDRTINDSATPVKVVMEW